MYKLVLCLMLVLMALAVFVAAADENMDINVSADVQVEDQETAEQYFSRYGYYPSWYTYGSYNAGARGYPYYPAAAGYSTQQSYSYKSYSPYNYPYNYFY